MKEIKGLNGLRFIAAFYVFIFHIQWYLGLSFLPLPLANIIGQGALGVNVFFVLSGFILTYVYQKDFTPAKLPSLVYYKQFILKRIARIYPVYLLGMLCSMLITSIFNNYPASYPLLLLLDGTMLESYVPPLSMQWYGGGGWSVSTEFFFYLLFPFILPFLLRISNKRHLFLMLIAALIMSSLPGAYFTLHQATRSELTYTFPPSRLPEFICGMLAAQLITRYGIQISERVALGLLIITSIYLATFGPQVAGYNVHNCVVIPAVIAVICVLSRSENTYFFRWIGSGFMNYLGKISFSFYVVQIPLLDAVDGLLIKGIIHRNENITILIIFILNIIFSIIVYELIEKKIHLLIVDTFFSKKEVVQHTILFENVSKK